MYNKGNNSKADTFYWDDYPDYGNNQLYIEDQIQDTPGATTYIDESHSYENTEQEITVPRKKTKPSRARSPALTYGAVSIIVGFGLAGLIIHPAIWPLCVLLAVWALILLKYRTLQNIIITSLATVFLIFYAWLGGSVIAGIKAPPGEKLKTFGMWRKEALLTIWAMLSGINLTEFGQKIRKAWLINLWMVPAGVLITKLAMGSMNKKEGRTPGSSYFANPFEVNLTGHQEGFLLGRDKEKNKEVVLPLKEVFEHILMDGAPGAGKSASIFIPNLLRVAKNGGYANLVVTDPKMELLTICGPILKEAGYRVLVYHPYAPEYSDAWNMLYYAQDYESVDDMVLTMIINTNLGGKVDPYWDQQTNTLLDLICYHLRETLGEKATMNHVQAIAGTAAPNDIEVTLKNSLNSKISLNAAGFFSKISGNDKVISSIMSDLPRRLKLWTMDPIRATTSKNEINFSELCSDKKVALFVVTPMDKKDQLRPLFATFFSQLFKVVQEKGRELNRLPRPLWFLLDEFANLGNIPGFDNFLTVVRGYKVGVVMGIQSLSQLEELYGPNPAKTIINACANYIVFPRIGLEDAKYFSAMLGPTTMETKSKQSVKEPFEINLGYKETISFTRRELMTPDEIRSLSNGDNLIVFAGTRRAILITPALYYKDPRWLKLGQECNSEELIKERKKLFARQRTGKEPLMVPSEERMITEAAFITRLQLDNGKGNRGRLSRQDSPDIGNGQDNSSGWQGPDSYEPVKNDKPRKSMNPSFSEAKEIDLEQDKNQKDYTVINVLKGIVVHPPSAKNPPRMLKIDKGSLFSSKNENNN